MHSEPITLNPAGRLAIKAFRSGKPWKGTLAERADKFADLHRALINAYGLETMLVRDDAADPECTGPSGSSHFDPRTNKIVLRGRLSVVSYLFCFAMVFRPDRDAAMRFARETFRYFFPRSYGGCREAGGLLVRDQGIRN